MRWRRGSAGAGAGALGRRRRCIERREHEEKDEERDERRLHARNENKIHRKARSKKRIADTEKIEKTKKLKKGKPDMVYTQKNIDLVHRRHKNGLKKRQEGKKGSKQMHVHRVGRIEHIRIGRSL